MAAISDKETMLTVIRENGWVTGVRRLDIILDLQQHYGISNGISQKLLQECLLEGLITMRHEKLNLTQRGRTYLQNIARNNYVNAAYEAANTGSRRGQKRKKASFWDWVSRWGALIGIPASLAGIAALLLTLPHC